MFREILDRAAHHLFRHPIAVLYGGLAVIGTIWGAIDIARKLEPHITNEWRSPLLMLLILLLLGPIIGWGLTSYRWRYGIHTVSHYVFPQIAKKWEIDSSGNAKLTTATTYLFLRDPGELDLFDAAFGSAPLKLEDLEYHSLDAVPRDARAISNHRHLIYWTPRDGGVEPGTPYTHTVVSHYPYVGPRPMFKALTIAPQALKGC